ncbi:MAG: hypothetical protein ACXW0Q_07180 [Methylovulum sp.]
MESIDFEDILNGDIDQFDETPYLQSDGMDAALDRWVDGTFALEAGVTND